tara:strand:+ start:45560 stop:46525 length:966 start_codon:yes stop_codon:yes gene_type:complete
MVKVGIIGGAGYTAGELLRILLNHPEAEVLSVMSGSHAGELITKAHPDLEGETDLRFSEALEPETEVVFLCSGHGKSKAIVDGDLIPKNARIIDLSADYRLKSDDNNFVYGLPELNRLEIMEADYIANPGCFATCIQLSLLPLASVGMLTNEVHVSAITGSTGAGQNPSSTTHFSWRSNNASVYKAFTHQHLYEIKQSIRQLQPEFEHPVQFIPMRGAFTRGILAACYLKTAMTEAEAIKLYESYYSTHPFVHISRNAVDVKQVTNTNKVILHIQKEKDQLLITGVIDNLTKGASGQAVQNMNLMFGLDETMGLNLKPSAF